MRCSVSTTWVLDSSGIEPTERPVFAALRHQADAGIGACFHDTGYFAGVGRPNHCECMTASAFAPVLFVGAEIALGEYVGFADDCAKLG